MRILLTAHQFLPRHHYGTEVLTRDTGLELTRRGHDVHVLTTDPSARQASAVLHADDYDHRGLSVHALRLPRVPAGPERLTVEYNNPSVAEHVRDYVEALAPEAVHMFHTSRLSASVIDVFADLGVPLVFTATDFWPFCARNILSKP